MVLQKQWTVMLCGLLLSGDIFEPSGKVSWFATEKEARQFVRKHSEWRKDRKDLMCVSMFVCPQCGYFMHPEEVAVWGEKCPICEKLSDCGKKQQEAEENSLVNTEILG